jgi:hypothetical protein
MAIAQDAWRQTERRDAAATPVIGRLCGGARDGAPLVDWDGGGPVSARPVARLDVADLCRPDGAGREVLLLFPADARPVIVDLLADPVAQVLAQTLAETLAAPEGPAPEARLDGDRVVLEGRREVVLRCGKASITLRRDGKVVVRGTELLSRATGRNRIKGASVAIN